MDSLTSEPRREWRVASGEWREKSGQWSVVSESEGSHHTHPTSHRIRHPAFAICHLPSAISPFRIPRHKFFHENIMSSKPQGKPKEFDGTCHSFSRFGH
jgi:hypothetical protein